MSKNDDEDLDDISPEELAQAQALAGRVDSLLAGEGLPHLAEAEERELAQMSSMIRSAHNEVALADERKAVLIEEALAQASGADKASFSQPEATSDMERARARRKKSAIAGALSLVAAAAIVLLLWRAQEAKPGEVAVAPTESALQRPMELPESQRSRPADPLVGQIPKSDSGRASERLQSIYSDRMRGYRALQYTRRTGRR